MGRDPQVWTPPPPKKKGKKNTPLVRLSRFGRLAPNSMKQPFDSNTRPLFFFRGSIKPPMRSFRATNPFGS